MRFSRKHLAILIFLSGAGLAFAFLSPAISVQETRAEDLFRRGLLLYSAGKFDASIDIFRESLAENPDFVQARRTLGQALYFTGQTEEAINEWSLALSQGSLDLPLSLHLQNLQSITLGTEGLDWHFQSALPQQRGFRFSFPVFTGMLTDNSLFFLTTGKEAGPALITLTPGGSYKKIVRRINGPLRMPMGAAQWEDSLWITDFESDSIHRLRISSLDGFVRSEKTLKPGLRGPAGICRFENTFAVADSGNNRIVFLDDSGAIVRETREVADSMELVRPFGLLCQKNSIYVSIPEQGRLAEYDRYGNFIAYHGDGILSKPRHLSSGKTETEIIIADEHNGIITLDTASGYSQFLKNFTVGENDKKFNRAYSAALDQYGNLYAADFTAHSVLRFVPEKQLYSNYDVYVERIISDSFPNLGLYVTVRDDQGNYITNLSAENFLLNENGSHTDWLNTDNLQPYQEQNTVIILLSRSAGMEPFLETLPWTLDFFLKDIREKDRLRLDSYSNEYRQDTEFTSSRLRILEAARRADKSDYSMQGSPALDEALYQSITTLLTMSGKRSVVLITEGDTANSFTELSADRIARYAKANHIPIHIINYENPDVQNAGEAQTLAEETGGKYYRAFDGLDGFAEVLRNQREVRYLLNYASGGKKEWHHQYMDIEVIVNFQGRKGREQTGYFIP